MLRRKSQDSVLCALDFCHRSEPIMAIFQCYFDESGKFKDHQVITFCGLCAPASRVQEFEEDWKQLLRSSEIKALSMKRALRRVRPLSPCINTQSAAERTEVLKPFALCIRKHFEIGVAIAIDVEAYSRLSALAKQKIGGSDNPFYMAFLCAVMAPSKRLLEEDRISIICDDDQETALNCYKAYRHVKKKQADLHTKLVALTFANDEAFVPLQAADMFASLVRLEARRRFKHEYYEWVSLFQELTHPGSIPSDLKWVLGFFDADKLEKTGKGLEKLF